MGDVLIPVGRGLFFVLAPMTAPMTAPKDVVPLIESALRNVYVLFRAVYVLVLGVYVLFWGVYVLYGLPEYNPPGQQLTLYVNVYANKLGSTAF